MLDVGHSNSKIKQRNNIDSISMTIYFLTHITTNLGERRGKEDKYTYHDI
jgi:hypothetical protein